VKVGFKVKHQDHAYVERRGGFELLTYMRAADGRATYRRAALDRAMAGVDVRIGLQAQAAGLVVLQRALLCAEDLGRLFHALAGPDAWQRLRSAQLPAIDDAYGAAVADSGAVRRAAFCLPTPEQLAEEGMGMEDRAAFGRLCGLVDARRARMMETAARLWLDHARVAKATMHGLPVLAGEHVTGPPGAGDLAASVPAAVRHGNVPYVAVLATSERDRHVNTEVRVLRMDRTAIAGWHRSGKVAARLYADLCEVQAGSIMAGCAAMVPTTLTDRLVASDQARIERLAAEHREDGGAAL